ncbi:MAG: MFS transporter [Caulobacterales bacterium]|nr:MFS transporter [Caulobacterales bacterium]
MRGFGAAAMVGPMSLAPSLAVFRHRAYLHYWIMRQLISAARQMTVVAIGWQIYELARETRSVEESAFLLGLVGLVQFAPVLFLSLIGGQAADRYDRKAILIISNVVRVAAIGVLTTTPTMASETAIATIFSVAAVLGGVNAFTPAASNALYPRLVPVAELPQAIAWNSLGFQASAITGPAIAGLLFAAGAAVVYTVAAVMTGLAVIAIATARTPPHEPVAGARGLAMVVEGLTYVRRNEIVFSAILLDLIVVFFGGVTALLPVFARDILHVGAAELGLMWASPAIGAGIVAFLLASRPLSRRVGKWMLGAVALYGLALLAFALSPVYWLSLVFLAVTGAADMVSVYVRSSLIQLATPDGLRGRVASVSFIFIAASNELGEFESGVAARFLGPIGAVLLGGTVAVATAGAWTRAFPALWNCDTFAEAARYARSPTSAGAGAEA